jgi:DNA mismatch endonuclease (patch repair protein)
MKHPSSYDSTPEIRKRMSKVKLKNGRAEMIFAKRLWHLGLRYRKNDKRLKGSPDIAILKYHIAIFIDGEFWHGKDWDIRRKKLKKNREYWIQKIEENRARDARVNKELEEAGWTVVRFWEKDVLKNIDRCLSEIIDMISAEDGWL